MFFNSKQLEEYYNGALFYMHPYFRKVGQCSTSRVCRYCTTLLGISYFNAASIHLNLTQVRYLKEVFLGISGYFQNRSEKTAREPMEFTTHYLHFLIIDLVHFFIISKLICLSTGHIYPLKMRFKVYNFDESFQSFFQ